MTASSPGISILLFLGKFALTFPVCFFLWWYAMPGFAWGLGQLGGGIMLAVTEVPIKGLDIEEAGILNTKTGLTYKLDGSATTLDAGDLMETMPVYWALVLSTAGLGWLRRGAVLCAGILLISATYLAFIVLALVFREQIRADARLPVALGQVVKALPFVLWVLLAYSPRLPEIFSALVTPAQKSDENNEASKPT